MDPGMIENVRLVIWDLDETFWRGTLTEGGIQYVQRTHDLVIELARRGIISSVCSKNDFTPVKHIMQKNGIWHYFVMPSINWEAKGPRVASLIESFQLRPQTVMLIDDNQHNLQEALFCSPGLQIETDAFVDNILNDPRFAGRPDPSFARLAQYKLLEFKMSEKSAYADDPHAFLRQSQIHAEIDYDIAPHLDRIVELVNRTNQLNFTKLRLSQDTEKARAEIVEHLEKHWSRRAGVVKVRDRFGDYGIVGFWMMAGTLQGFSSLVHFVFSCRTLGMGIEQWTYERLGRPSLSIIGTVVSELNFDPDWINAEPAIGAQSEALPQMAVVLRGGCELEVMKHFFSFDTRDVTGEFVFNRGAETVWLSHIATLLYAEKTAKPFIHYNPGDFTSSFRKENALIVFSNSGDTIVPLYRHKKENHVIPAYSFAMPPYHAVTDDGIEKAARQRKLSTEQLQVVKQSVREIKRDFDLLDFTLDDMIGAYHQVFSGLSETSLLILLLPVEFVVNPDGSWTPFEKQIAFNAALRAISANYENVRTLDTGDFIKSPGDLSANSRFHFRREIYYQIYRTLKDTYATWQADSRLCHPPRASQAAVMDQSR